MEKTQYKHAKRAVRHNRIRAKVTGTTERPRLAIYKSNRFVYAQLIDDQKGITLASADSRQTKGTMTEGAIAVGAAIAKAAVAKGVTTVVFDRGGFKYQGLIAALADSARGNGLTF
ncbi:MAG: 50S ribosomal protein L18 [Candidatus Paceibacteria bacterium]